MSGLRWPIVLLASASWCALFYGALTVSSLKLGYYAGICGSWGCLPETAPMISMHLMWLVILGGGLLLISLVTETDAKIGVWLGCSLLSACTVCCLVALQYISFTKSGGQLTGVEELLRFAAFHLLIQIDIPATEFCVVCSALTLRACFRLSKMPHEVTGINDGSTAEQGENELPS